MGRNAFAHEAGIHQHGVLSNPLCYEIMTPESVGMPGDRIVLGKHSGRHALMHRFNELGLNVAGDELEALYTKFTHLADRKKKVYDQDLISMVATHRGPVSDSPNHGDRYGQKSAAAIQRSWHSGLRTAVCCRRSPWLHQDAAPTEFLPRFGGRTVEAFNSRMAYFAV